ncbi:MAG: DUF975 family protein [Lachnospiraceae bacterium]|nr:DUF975 family protein [Lachnospiraceae bacterium]
MNDASPAVKTSLSDIRGLARETILDNPYAPVLITLIYFVFKFGFSMCFGGILLSDALWAQVVLKCISFIVNVMLGLLIAGRIRYFTLLCEDKNPFFGDLFSAFRKGPDRVLKASFVIQGIWFLCSLPGFIYSAFYPVGFDNTPENLKHTTITLILILLGYLIAYLVTVPFMPLYYILGDYVNMPLSKAIRMSYWLMKGNYFRYIGLCISMIPLIILCILSFGITLLWISPFIQSTFAHFYLDLVNQKQKSGN